MSVDKTLAALDRVIARLDALEAKIDERSGNGDVPSSAESFPDYDEYPDLTVVPDPVAEDPKPHPRATEPPPIHRPGDLKTVPLDASVEWVEGQAKLPTSDMPVSLGSSSGHTLTEEQLARSWQRDMVAPMRMRPVEDAV